MKEAELRANPQCHRCGRLWGHTGLPIIHKMVIERHVLNLPAIQRQTGLAMMLGSARLASHMGPGEDMTVLVDSEVRYLCGHCLVEVTLPGLPSMEASALAAPAAESTPPTPTAGPAAPDSPDSPACAG